LKIADRLDRLAQLELDEVQQFISTQTPINCAVLLIEACRCLDHAHVRQLLSSSNDGKPGPVAAELTPRSEKDVFATLAPDWKLRVGAIDERSRVSTITFLASN
jgi:hypothetical protein